MMKVRMIDTGDVYEYENGYALRLIEQGKAVLVEGDTPPTPTPVPVDVEKMARKIAEMPSIKLYESSSIVSVDGGSSTTHTIVVECEDSFDAAIGDILIIKMSDDVVTTTNDIVKLNLVWDETTHKEILMDVTNIGSSDYDIEERIFSYGSTYMFVITGKFTCNMVNHTNYTTPEPT